jgi:hypothetical protein
MSHPEYAVPVYMGTLVVLLILWLLLPITFVALLVIKSRLERREVEWLEEGSLLPREEIRMDYYTFFRGWGRGG